MDHEPLPNLERLSLSEDQTGQLAKHLRATDRPYNQHPETSLHGAQEMYQAIINNKESIQNFFRGSFKISLDDNDILDLALSVYLSDIGKAGDPDDPDNPIAAFYFGLRQLTQEERALPLHQALSHYDALSLEALISVTQTYLGDEFNPQTTSTGEVLTKLHLKVAEKLFRDLGILNQPAISLALAHHFDRWPYPDDIAANRDSKLTLLAIFSNTLDKLHASRHRGGHDLPKAVQRTRQDIKSSLKRYHQSLDVLLPHYRQCLDFLQTYADAFFPAPAP